LEFGIQIIDKRGPKQTTFKIPHEARETEAVSGHLKNRSKPKRRRRKLSKRAATLVPGRTNLQCYSRWTHTLDTAGKTAGRWKPEEDAKLIEAVKKHGKAWVAVAAMIPGRTNHQCYHRCIQSLNPSNGKKKGQWKPEEDTKLIEAVTKHGKNWVVVATLVPGRTDQQCRQRWVQSLNPSNGKKKGQWKPEEDTS
jgi:myb proto-oncogene protein